MTSPTLSVPEACELLGISTWMGYELIRRDEFPVPVLRLGRRIRIPRAPLMDLLGMKADLTVELPDHPPALSPKLARLLLQIIQEDQQRPDP